MQSLVFSGKNALEFLNLRSALMRIPEVSLRVKEAQSIVDSLKLSNEDLLGCILSEDSYFHNQFAYKKIAILVTQLGLWDRFSKLRPQAEWLIAADEPISISRLLSGEKTLVELIKEAYEKPQSRHLTLVAGGEEIPVLTGTHIEVFQALKRNENGVYAATEYKQRVLVELLKELSEKNNVMRFIEIGPQSAGLEAEKLANDSLMDIEVSNSIDMDPWLHWFNPSLQLFAVAQA